MPELEQIMERHSDLQSIRALYAVYRPIVDVIRASAALLRSANGFSHESGCLDSQARSAEQTYARMMREAVKREAATEAT